MVEFAKRSHWVLRISFVALVLSMRACLTLCNQQEQMKFENLQEYDPSRLVF